MAEESVTLKTVFDIGDVRKKAQQLRRAIDDSLSSSAGKQLDAELKSVQNRLKSLAEESTKLDRALYELEKRNPNLPLTKEKYDEQVKVLTDHIEQLKKQLEDVKFDTPAYHAATTELQRLNDALSNPLTDPGYAALAQDVENCNYVLEHFAEMVSDPSLVPDNMNAEPFREMNEELTRAAKILEHDEQALQEYLDAVDAGAMAVPDIEAKLTANYEQSVAKVDELKAHLQEMMESVKEFRDEQSQGMTDRLAEMQEEQAAAQEKVVHAENEVTQAIQDQIDFSEQRLANMKDAAEQADELVKQQEEINNQMRQQLELQESIEDIQQAEPEISDESSGGESLSEMSGSIENLLRLTSQLPGVLGNVKKGINAVRVVLKGFKLSNFLGLLLAIAGVLIKVAKIMFNMIKEDVERANKVMLQLGNAIKTGLVASVKGLGKLFTGLGKTVSKVFLSMGKLMTSTIKKMGGLFAVFNKALFSMGKAIGGLLWRGVTALISRLSSLKGVVQEYLPYLAKWNNGNNAVNKSLSNLTSSLKYVKGSLAAAFVPILTVIEPALTRLANRLAEIITLIGMFFAKLTGAKTFIKATRIQEDYADSISGVGSAAEEAEKQLASYDKLEVIQQDKSKSGGGGGGAGVGFEEVELPDLDLDEWLNGLYAAGAKFGMWLRDFLNSIPWSKIQEIAGKLGKGIADFINGFVEVSELAESIGNALGEAINTITEFFYNLLDNLHFDSIGHFLGRAFMTAVETIEWGRIGQTLAKGVNGLFEILKNFAFEVDGLKVGEKVGELIDNILSELDWGTIKTALTEISKDLATFLNGLAEPKRFAAIGEAVANSFNIMWDSIYAFFSNLNGIKIGNSLDALFDNFFGKINWQSVDASIRSIINDLGQIFNRLFTVDNLGKIGDAIGNLGTVIWNAFSQITDQLKGSDIGLALDALVDKLFGGVDWAKINSTVNNFVKDLTDIISNVITPENMGEIGSALSNTLTVLLNSIHTFFDNFNGEDIGASIGALFDEIFGNIDWDTVDSTLSLVIEDLVGVLNSLITPERFAKIGENLGTLVNTILSNIGTFVSEFDWDSAADSLVAGISNFFETVDWEKAGGNVSEIADKLLDFLIRAIDELDTDEIISKLNEFIGSIDFEKLSGKVSELTSKLRVFLKEVIDNVDWLELWTFVKNAASDIFDIGDFVKSVINWNIIGNVIKEAWDNSWIVQIWTDLVDDFKTNFNEGDWIGIGTDILQGILHVLLFPGELIINAVTGLFDFFTGALKNIFGIASPAKSMFDIGENIVLGIIEGFNLVDFFAKMQEWWNTNIVPWFTLERWQEVTTGMIEGVGAAMDALTTLLQEKWTAIKDDIATKVEAIKANLQEKWAAIKENISTKITEIRDTLVQKWELIRAEAQGKAELIKTTVLLAWENLKTGTIEKFNTLRDKIVEAFNSIKDRIKAPINAIIGFVESMVNGIVNGINSMIDKLNGLNISVPKGAAKYLGTDSIGFNIPKLSTVSLPRLAQGAVIPPNREFAAVLGDQKSGTNVETPLETMVQAFKMALAETGGARNPIILQLNGKVVAQAVWDEEAKRYKQTGQTTFA